VPRFIELGGGTRERPDGERFGQCVFNCRPQVHGGVERPHRNLTITRLLQNGDHSLVVGEGERSGCVGIHRLLRRQQIERGRVRREAPFILPERAPADKHKPPLFGETLARIGQCAHRLVEEHHPEA